MNEKETLTGAANQLELVGVEVKEKEHGIDWYKIIDAIVEHEGPVTIPEPFTEPFLNDLLEAAVDYALEVKNAGQDFAALVRRQKARQSQHLLREYWKEKALDEAKRGLKRIAATNCSCGAAAAETLTRAEKIYETGRSD